MKSQKKTFDLDKLAARAKATTSELPTQGDETLEKLKKNIGKTVLLPPKMLVIKDNIRQILDITTIKFRQLVESIRKNGVKQNLQGSLKIYDDQSWELICTAGQRRLLAALEVERDLVPVRIELYTDESSFIEDSLIENLLREDLHTLDVAIAYLRLYNMKTPAGSRIWPPERIAEQFEREKDTVMKMMRLARFPEKAHEIIRLYPEKFTSTILIGKFVSRRWPSDEALIAALESFALQVPIRESRRTITDHEVKIIETNMIDMGVKAKSKGSKENGQIVLSWNSPEEFNRVQTYLAKKEEGN